MTILGLYKTVGSEERLIDYGVISKLAVYRESGYDVKLIKGIRPALYKHAKAEFVALWNTLGHYHQRRLADIPVDDENNIYEKLDLLKAEMVAITRRRNSMTLTRRPKRVSIWSAIKREAQNLFTLPNQEVCYA